MALKLLLLLTLVKVPDFYQVVVGATSQFFSVGVGSNTLDGVLMSLLYG
jgi:hypothetical protein